MNILRTHMGHIFSWLDVEIKYIPGIEGHYIKEIIDFSTKLGVRNRTVLFETKSGRCKFSGRSIKI